MSSIETPSAIHLKDYIAPEFQIDTINLVVSLFDDRALVESEMKLIKSNSGAGDLRLNGKNMELLHVELDGKVLGSLDYHLSGEYLTLNGVRNGSVVKIHNEIWPDKNTALDGLYTSNGAFCTQNEPEGFRNITYYLDRPDVMAKYTTTIIADKLKYPILLANGNKVDAGELEAGRHFAKWEDPFRKPSYLFAMVAGDFGMVRDFYTTKSGRKITLEIYVDKGNENKCDHAMQSLKNSMRWDEDTYGLEYDLDIYMIVAVDAFNFGAMENKGLNIFNSAYVLARPETATDDNFLDIEGVIGHEYFHNWTGNRVTCRDWFQLTLKEGLTVFRDQEFSSDMNSRAVKRIQDVRTLKERQFPEDAGPLSHPIRPESYIQINNFYTATIYEKGAEIIRMIETMIGKSTFKKGITKYFELYDGKAITTEDFIYAMQLASGKSLEQFKRWYSTPGTPHVSVQKVISNNGSEVTLKFSQTNKIGHELHIPIKFGLINDRGEEIILPNGKGEMVFELKTMEDFITLPINSTDVIPSLNRDFSAPIHVDYQYSDSDLIHLLAYDSNAYVRYESAQLLYTKEIIKAVRCLQSGLPLEVNSALFDSLGKVVHQSSHDRLFAAELLQLPTDETINELLPVCDFENVDKAMNWFKQQLALKFKDQFLQIIEGCREDGFQLSSESIGKRSLKNCCWSFLATLNEKSINDKMVLEFHRATNMTDEISLFALLVQREDMDSQKAILYFYEKWNAETLVMQKWIAAQAKYIRKDIWGRLASLESDAVYNPKIPNLVRSLIGQFISFNLISFHDISGRGYEYLTKKVIEIDAYNPQLASRLATKFKRFSNLDDKRNELIKIAMTKIASNPKLSRDTFEVIKKNLENA